MLDSSRKSSHSLAEELKICQNYLAIETYRFGERLRVKFSVDAAVNPNLVQIPSLLLQPLVENAVKHGIAPRASGGEILLTVKGLDSKLLISIEDNGVGFGNSPSKAGAQSGLANCRSRIELKYGAGASFEVRSKPEGGTAVEILLPNKATENHS